MFWQGSIAPSDKRAKYSEFLVVEYDIMYLYLSQNVLENAVENVHTISMCTLCITPTYIHCYHLYVYYAHYTNINTFLSALRALNRTVDITEGIPKSSVIYWCKGCERYVKVLCGLCVAYVCSVPCV